MRKNHTPFKESVQEKDLISSKERSQPSKLLAFLSRQMHQIKQWGSNLQTSMWRCRANFPCQALNNSRTVRGITHWIPNKQKTKDHNSQAWSNEVEDDPPTSHISSTDQALSHVSYEGCLLLRSYLRKQTKKRKLPLEELLTAISFSMEGNNNRRIEGTIISSNFKTSIPCRLPTNLI